MALLCKASPAATDPSAANLALVALPTTSYHSGDTDPGALADGEAPSNSADFSHGSYGNWPRTGTEWVQYDWTQPIATKQISVYWWADGQGVGVPKSCRVLYWNGKEFVPVEHPNGLGVARDQFNATTFDEVHTDKLRLEIESDGKLSTGILEWKVNDSGHSPAFPPSVSAGVDRMVVIGGNTYLSGKVKTLSVSSRETNSRWSTESGPAAVSLKNADSVETTATFSEPGDYVLKLTAGEGKLTASSTLKVRAVAPSPKERLDVVYTKRYSIDSPLWNARVKALVVNWIPHCIDYNNRTGGALSSRGSIPKSRWP